MPISDERLLELIESGDIVVGLDNPEAISVFGRSNRAYLIGGGGKRNAPDDFDIHHLDEDPHNDDYENLISLHKDDHKKLHASLNADADYVATQEFLNS